MNKLTPKQALFCKEYMVDRNATQAYIRTGYSKKCADVSGPRLLGNVRIKKEIDRLTLKQAAKIEITAQRVLDELAKMGFANMQDYTRIQDGEAVIDLSVITRDQMAAVSEVTSEVYTEGKGGPEVKRTKLKIFDKKASLELLGKHLKLFNGHGDETKPNDGRIQVDFKNMPIQEVLKFIMDMNKRRA